MIDLEKEMKDVSWDMTHGMDSEEYSILALSNAIKIAKQAIEDACKRQREICAKNIPDAISAQQQKAILRAIKCVYNAPLATEGYTPKSWSEISGYVAMNDSKSKDISNMSFDGSLSRINQHWGNSQQIKRCKILISK